MYTAPHRIALPTAHPVATTATARQIMLVGLGPHARRIYMHSFGKYGMAPAVVVELEEKSRQVQDYLTQHTLTPDVYLLPDAARDAETLPPQAVRALDALVRKNAVTHVILSTEPKAHKAYLRYCLSRGLHTLTDKPITAPVNPITSLTQAARIEHDFDDLMRLYTPQKAKGMRLSVQCQRRFHPAYTYLHGLIADLTRRYGVGITHMDVYHCDGMWNMPDEFLFRENHPYKYGYGKLYHSGYHFIDLAAWLLQAADLPPHKRPDGATLYATAKRPADVMAAIDGDDHARLLGTNRFQELTAARHGVAYGAMGEVDFYGMLTLTRGRDALTHCTFNLLQSGFSRRSWDKLPADTYKGNGRVRHERLNIQLGPLANIQVHSYQAKEVKERATDHEGVGGLEHFDIHIFRNTALIGGAPVETLTQQQIIGDTASNARFIGYNELARERCLLAFLRGDKDCPSDLSHHRLGIQLMRASYEAMARAHHGQAPLAYFVPAPTPCMQ
jgi:predicted dehydrogenase